MIAVILGNSSGNRSCRESFADAEMVLTHMHYTVLNPGVLPGGLDDEQREDIIEAMIDHADIVCLLPKWEKDSTAVVLHEYAKICGARLIKYKSIKPEEVINGRKS